MWIYDERVAAHRGRRKFIVTSWGVPLLSLGNAADALPLAATPDIHPLDSNVPATVEVEYNDNGGVPRVQLLPVSVPGA